MFSRNRYNFLRKRLQCRLRPWVVVSSVRVVEGLSDSMLLRNGVAAYMSEDLHKAVGNNQRQT